MVNFQKGRFRYLVEIGRRGRNEYPGNRSSKRYDTLFANWPYGSGRSISPWFFVQETLIRGFFMTGGVFQKSLPSLPQLRPISYTDLPGFAGSGTPLFKMSAGGGSGISGQLKASAAPDAGTTGDGSPASSLQKAIPSIGIIVVIVLALILLH
jgi:pimeloyl-ACP methyl ester carboxylesterase